jgi:hypothetical protein
MEKELCIEILYLNKSFILCSLGVKITESTSCLGISSGNDALLTVGVRSGVGPGDLFIPIDYLHLVLEFLQELLLC